MEILGSLPAGPLVASLAGIEADTSPLAASGSGSSPWGTLIFFVVLVGLLYVIFLRPQRHRVRKAAELQRELVPGQQVMTAGGLFGTVAAIEDDAVILEVAPGVTTRWAKQAIGRVVTPPEALGVDPVDDAEQTPQLGDPRDHVDRADPEPPPGERPDGEPGR